MVPFLLISDDNYMKALIAQINSIYRYFPEPKIYLVHNLNKDNLKQLGSFVYKQEYFNDFDWKHLENRKGHITKTNFGKFQVGFIEEDNLFYMDTDVIVNKNFLGEITATMTCEARLIDIRPEDKYYKSKNLIRQFVIANGGVIKSEGKFTLFSDGGYFRNKEWILNVLKPKIIWCSKNMPQAEPHWYGLGFFNATISLLGRPIKHWNLEQLLISLFPDEDIKEYDLIHYVGSNKPWHNKRGNYSHIGEEAWWDNYLNGVIRIENAYGK